ncbi:MAG: hypothetical protein IAA96_05095 [Spirochaetes bacterium]|uniref:Uncharacterized protein n=1 Tax=Candidatus Avitreponema avistercoris TaxID=2840705 RepID=A0A9D9HDR9_9SPIR|nr:hypothetical protein [Candidatus Avitreponema avistercoris]
MNDKQIQKFAKDNGYKGASHWGRWKEWDVYEPFFEENEVSYVGPPLMILTNSKETRFTTYEEAFEIP